MLSSYFPNSCFVPLCHKIYLCPFEFPPRFFILLLFSTINKHKYRQVLLRFSVYLNIPKVPAYSKPNSNDLLYSSYCFKTYKVTTPFIQKCHSSNTLFDTLLCFTTNVPFSLMRLTSGSPFTTLLQSL